MTKRVLVVGGTGFIGGHVSTALLLRGEQTVVLSRFPVAPSYQWDYKSSFIDPHALQDVDSVVYLAGASLTEKRLTENRKRLCEESRIMGTRFIIDSCKDAGIKLSCFIAASDVGYFGHSSSTDESTMIYKVESSPPGTDWLSKLCMKWEEEILRAHAISQRVAILRIAPVLGIYGGVYPKFALAARLGLAAPIGTGKQPFPWIHIDDATAIVLRALHDQTFDGTFNCTAPDSVSNAAFMEELARSLNRLCILPRIPRNAVKVLLGSERANMLLGGSLVSGDKLKQLATFDYKYPTLQLALDNLAECYLNQEQDIF